MHFHVSFYRNMACLACSAGCFLITFVFTTWFVFWLEAILADRIWNREGISERTGHSMVGQKLVNWRSTSGRVDCRTRKRLSTSVANDTRKLEEKHDRLHDQSDNKVCMTCVLKRDHYKSQVEMYITVGWSTSKWSFPQAINLLQNNISLIVSCWPAYDSVTDVKLLTITNVKLRQPFQNPVTCTNKTAKNNIEIKSLVHALLVCHTWKTANVIALA